MDKRAFRLRPKPQGLSSAASGTLTPSIYAYARPSTQEKSEALQSYAKMQVNNLARYQQQIQ